MGALLREPFVRFLLIGGALFAISRVRDRNAPEAPKDRIVVTAGHLEQMTLGFTRTWRRPPTASELDGLVRDHVLEQALSREAAAMGLGEDDLIIRRRLRQKLEAVLQDVGGVEVPTEAALREFHAAKPELFSTDGIVSFRQVFVNRDRRGASAEADAGAVLARLRSGEDPGGLGDPTLLPAVLSSVARQAVDLQFGGGFAAGLFSATPGAWTGPIASAYGLHLVQVSEIRPGRAADYDSVREEVLKEWTAARRRAALDEATRKILERYTVVVEPASGAKP